MKKRRAKEIHAEVMRGLSASTPRFRSVRGKKHRTLVYEVINLDVWGNEEDGYEVNDMSRTGREIEVECREEHHNVGTPHEFTSCHPTDRAIIAIMVREGWFKKGVTTKDVNVEGESDYTLYLEDSKTGYPLYHLERVEGG